MEIIPGPKLKRITNDRERDQASISRDLGELHALFTIKDAILSLKFITGITQ
jgi:hypothetical protein